MASATGSLTVEIRTPDGPVFSGNAAKVVCIPGSKAPFGVRPRHAPLMSSVEMGETRLVDATGTTWTFATGPGFVEVQEDTVLLLVDTAEDVTEIDVGRAEQARERARERLAKPTPEVDRARAEAAMERATTRLRLASGR